jgi:hypothetical protein
MVTMFVKHPVREYGAWKRTYDALASVRKNMGVTGAAVYRDASEPNLIVVTHQFSDLDAASKFAHSDELRTAMMNAGVSGPPEIWYCQDVESTAY